MSWDLIVKAVEAHTDQPWVLLYVKRWLEAPLRQADGVLTARDRGTPQGSAVSPVLANLFLHYAFDAWMAREFPSVPFERYVDDAVVHCVSELQARTVLAAIGDRMEQVGLRLHPDKTRIVYCQDGQRRGSHEHTSFTFLGYEFRQRAARNKNGQKFNAFLPAISKHALKRISAEVRSWRLHHRTGHTFADLARWINPIVRGWMQYYGAFYRSGAVSTPLAHQRLPGALDPHEIPTAARREKSHRVLAGDYRKISPHVRALDMDSLGFVRLVTRRTRAR